MLRLLSVAFLAVLHMPWATAEQNAVYAKQLTFETSSPIMHITTGICIGEP